MKKKAFGLSDGNMFRLWRLAVKSACGNKCIICGSSEKLECHHIVHTRAKLLRWDWRNGVTVCNPMNDKCHAFCDTLEGRGRVQEFVGPEIWCYLKLNEPVIHKDYLREQRLSETDWRILVRKDLEDMIG